MHYLTVSYQGILEANPMMLNRQRELINLNSRYPRPFSTFVVSLGTVPEGFAMTSPLAAGDPGAPLFEPALP